MRYTVSRLSVGRFVAQRNETQQISSINHLDACGEFGTPSWRLFYKRDSTTSFMSPWHDISRQPQEHLLNSCKSLLPERSKSSDFLEQPNLFMYVNEIPRGTRHKLEMCKEEQFNPIAHDVQVSHGNNSVRLLKYGDMPFNYGFIPQTWECPDLDKLHSKDVESNAYCVNESNAPEHTPYRGDGDPLDVAVLGPPMSVGAIHIIRVLGVLGLIDSGELDWKLIAESLGDYTKLCRHISQTYDISVGRAKANKEASTVDTSTRRSIDDDIMRSLHATHYRTLNDVPTSIKADMIDWFENYKTAESKPRNTFIYAGEFRGLDDALRVAKSCAEGYDNLITSKCNKYRYWLGEQNEKKQDD